MSLEAFLTAFSLIFIAELGDKTQLTILMLATRGNAIRVLIGAMMAFTLISTLSVFLGNFLSLFLPVPLLKLIAGTAFILIGAIFPIIEKSSFEKRNIRGHFDLIGSFTLISLMELGDKTQLATILLSIRYVNEYFTLLSGIFLAFLLLSLIGVSLGKLLIQRLPQKALKILTSALFLVLGLWFLIEALPEYNFESLIHI